MQIIDFNICDECNGTIIQHNHEKVCQKCGLIINDIEFRESYQMNENADSEFRENDQFVSIGKTVDSVTTLGSTIGYYNSKSFYDYRKQIISQQKQKMFTKFKKYYLLPTKIKNHETDYRIFKILNIVTQYLHLSNDLKKRAAYLYRLIKKKANKVNNHVTLIAFCIFYCSRQFENKAPINIKELCKIFTDLGHRMTPRLIIRNNIQYSKYIPKRKKPHKSEDYIIKLVNKVIEWPVLQKRLQDKDINMDIIDYEKSLIHMSNLILKKLDYRKRGSRNPFIMAATTVYCADRLIAKKNKTKKILTQKTASECMEIPHYSIRDHFVKVFKNAFDL